MQPATLPSVSIIVPCYNEAATIGLLLEALLQQTYPRSRMEVVIADGLSQDGTRDVIAAFQQTHPDLQVNIKENACRTIPTGLNLAGASARGEILIRLDAHCMPIPEYVERCVDDLVLARGSVVGGIWSIRPGGRGFIAEAIARAASHPLGVGDAMYRLRATEGAVDTVPFGAFRRTLFEQLKGFDESLLTNEDYEFNTRVRQRGEIVWLDPLICSTYIARSTLSALARQYWRYGYWKFQMLRRHPTSVRWRQALPPVFAASLVVLAVLSIFLPPARFLFPLELALYTLVLAAAGLLVAIRSGRSLLMPGLVLAIATMHLSWGSGFLWSIFAAPRRSDG